MRRSGRDADHAAAVLPAQGKHWTKDIPSLVSQAAEAHAGTTYRIAEPLGLDDLILDLLHKRFNAADEQLQLDAGQQDPRLVDLPPTERRVQCATCPFTVDAAGTIQLRPDRGITLQQLAARAATA